MSPTMRTRMDEDGREQAFQVCMATDAFRMAMGQKPKHFTPGELNLWLKSLENPWHSPFECDVCGECPCVCFEGRP